MEKYNFTLSDLNIEMFDTIKKLKNKEISVQDCKSIAEIGQVIVNSAKTQVDFLNVLTKSLNKEDINIETLKVYTGSFVSDGLDLEQTLKQIEDKNKNIDLKTL